MGPRVVLARGRADRKLGFGINPALKKHRSSSKKESHKPGTEKIPQKVVSSGKPPWGGKQREQRKHIDGPHGPRVERSNIL
jgi:hypothetical protein